MNHDDAQVALHAAATLLEETGCSFFISIVTPTQLDGVKPLNLSAVNSAPLQASNLLTSVWYGLAQFFLDHHESIVTPEVVEGQFTVGAATTVGVMQVCQDQHTVEEVAKHIMPIEMDA